MLYCKKALKKAGLIFTKIKANVPELIPGASMVSIPLYC